MKPKTRVQLPSVLLFVLLMMALILQPSAAQAQQQLSLQSKHQFPVKAQTNIQQSDENILSFSLVIPTPVIATGGVVSVPGLETRVSAAGAPALPYYSTYVAVPPQASVTIEVSEQDQHSRSVPAIQPAPTIELRGDTPVQETTFPVVASTLTETEPLFIAEPAIYEQDSLYPAQPYSLSEPMVARDLRLVQLNLYPLRYNPTSQTLTTSTLQVNITFNGAVLGEPYAATATASSADPWRESILNAPPQSWRIDSQTAVQRNQADAAVPLPVGTDTFKIEVAEDGIYEISGSELAAAGMNLAAVDVSTLQMMYRGKSVAFQFIEGGGSAALEPQDKIRFYGWGFDGSRYEDMYVDRNVFWLWSGGTSTKVQNKNNGSGGGYQVVTDFPESITEWPHDSFFSGWGVDWDKSPNDPTAWYWVRFTIPQKPVAPVAGTIDLPDPAPGANEKPTITTEFTSRLSPTSGASTHTYMAAIDLNNKDVPGDISWTNQANVNLVSKPAVSQLLQPGDVNYPANKITLNLDGNVAGDTEGQLGMVVYLTRVTVDYTRRLVALDDELQFGRTSAGNYEYQVASLSEGNASKALVWDISDRLNPHQITLEAQEIVDDGGSYIYKIRTKQAANGRFIVTTSANIHQVANLSKVVTKSLKPSGGGAEWLAISHKSLLPAAERLATFRGTQSGMSTKVVDIEDIVNQFGYGYHTPQAVRAFLQDALATWSIPPAYVTLMGDATVNPRGLECTEKCPDNWDPSKPNLVSTDFLFIDRFNGLIPVDYTMALLVGEDLIPDIGLARIAAETLSEAQNTVSKIITYEKNLTDESPKHDRFLFIADNTDGAGNFCDANTATVAKLPGYISSTQLCLEEPTEDATAALRTEMFNQINNVGLAILNYRGHGSIESWAEPPILDIKDAAVWQNVNYPLVLISADCLDGYFATAYTEALGETFVGLDSNRGTAAHWSSTGLGYTFEHSVLHSGFYEAIFSEGLLRLGDAVNYAKVKYLTEGYDTSEAYAFTLLGDPAMPAGPWVIDPNVKPKTNIPVIVAQ